MNSILIIGCDRPEALEMSYSRAFAKLGWRVQRWNPAAALAAASRGGRIGRTFASFVPVEPWRRKANVGLLPLAQALRPDIVLIVAAEGLRAGTIAQLQVLSPATKVVAAYPDSAHSLDAERIACLSVCDHVGVSAPSWVPAFQKLIKANVSYLPFAADTELYRPNLAAGTVAPTWDVGFVGTWRPEREALLESMSGLRTRIWGSRYWKSRTQATGKVRRMWAGGELAGDDFTDACAKTAIMLNILDPITWPGPNMRSFELPACNAFSLSSRSSAILEIFHEGTDIECFDSPGEALEKARHYLSRPADRLRIARAAHELVLKARHTYVDRARSIAAWTL